MSNARDPLVSAHSDSVGATRVFFELHTFHGNYWLCVKTAAHYPEALGAAEQALADQVGGGIRIARCTEYFEYDFIARSVLTRNLHESVFADPATPLLFPGVEADGPCRTPADLRGDRQREVVAVNLQRFLDESRLTPLELLHSETHALRLNDAGTVLQGALQRTAIAQVHNTDIPVQRRFKELLALTDATLGELRNDAQRHPVPSLTPGGYGALCAEIDRRFPAKAAGYHLFRALAAWLAGFKAKSWLAKLRMLDALIEEGLAPRHIMPLDALAAEILSAGPALAELAGSDADRLTQVQALVDFYGGRYRAPEGSAVDSPEGFERLIAAGACPRIQAALQRRLMREIMNPAPLQANWALWNQAQALHRVLALLKDTPPLGNDAEMLNALEQRAMRGINPENIRESLGTCRLASERVLALVRIADLMPHSISKTKMAEFVRAAWSLEDLIREGSGGKGDRSPAVPLLARIYKEIGPADIDVETRDKLLADLDGALFDILRTDVMTPPNRAFSERVMQLLKLCAASALPRGKARNFATEVVNRAINSPEFLDPFLKRFQGEEARKQALLSLRKLLLASGLAGR
jgi:hypothetical protein